MIITWNLCFSMGFPTWKPGQLSPGMPCHRQWASRLLHNGFDPAQSLGLAKPYEHESSCIHLYKTAYYCYPHQCSFSQTSAFFTFVSVRVNFKWTILFAQKFQDTKPSHKISDMSTVNSKKKTRNISARFTQWWSAPGGVPCGSLRSSHPRVSRLHRLAPARRQKNLEEDKSGIPYKW